MFVYREQIRRAVLPKNCSEKLRNFLRFMADRKNTGFADHHFTSFQFYVAFNFLYFDKTIFIQQYLITE